MACTTLKRSMELDPLCVRPSKRRRCIPISSPGTPAKEERISPFADLTPRLSMDQISTSIKDEMKRLHRRKKLYHGSESTPNGPASPSSSSDLAIDLPASPQSSSQLLQQQILQQDKHLFTFRQVGMICERLLKEREDSLRELYDQVLNAKLAEQYDTFVKFTYDQIQKRFDSSAAPSYLS